MSRQRPVKSIFIRSFLSVLSLSLIATLLTWGLLAALVSFLFQHEVLRPANYYEKQIPAIEHFANSKGELLLSLESQAELEQLIPSSGISYGVVASKGQFLYGDPAITKRWNQDAAAVQVTPANWIGGNITRSVPIHDHNGEQVGTLLLEYSLRMTAVNPGLSPWINSGVLFLFLTPFLYIALFTYLFGKQISRMISRPLQQLLDGAGRIKERNLHFSMSESSPVTEMNELTVAFEEMRKELAQSLEREWKQEQERKTMFAALAHDLRTPLTIIQGHVEGLEEMNRGSKESPVSQYLNVIKRNTANAAHLLKDMNTIAELEHMSFHLQPIPMDIEEFIEEKTIEYKALCADKNITFISACQDERTSVQPILFDPYRIAQILDNLVANSIRHTPAAGTITWSIEMNEHQVKMAISDTGNGFDSQELKQVFERFYQGQGRAPRQKGHAGLGLYIAKLLVSHHGGQITAANHPEGGAMVSFSFPLRTDSSSILSR
ncbi:HAMP domain-containing sensor histidine kinase [Paenibacillus cisolokensis]|uniref:HAMP domain-containing sensor histidine kinase n=1 Tax=Paenibacillus cisolokensis TaxID=1658519 RepID=UPI003D2B3445